jgi:hypothetical protein
VVQSVCGAGQGLLLMTLTLPAAAVGVVPHPASGPPVPVAVGTSESATVLVWGAAEGGDPWALLSAAWPVVSAAAAAACKEWLRGVPSCRCGW